MTAQLRTHRELSDADIARIAGTYNSWKSIPSTSSMSSIAYADIPSFCKSVSPDDIRKHGHVLTSGRYVGAEEVEDDGVSFDEKMQRLVAQLRIQHAEAAKLDAAIAKNLEVLGYG